MKKVKVIILSILWAILMILFPVLSGVLIGVLSAVTSKDYHVVGLYIQSFFILLPIIIALVYFRCKKQKVSDLGINFKFSQSYWLFVPCILIFIPMLFGDFAWQGGAYFLGCLLLYLMVGISEEIYFRGIIPNLLIKEFNVFYLILISTVIFGFGHSSVLFTGISKISVFLTVLNALIFGWLAIELKVLTKNITFLMLFHFLFDFLTKFITTSGQGLLTLEIIRGTIMTIYAAILLVVIINKTKQGQLDNAISK